MALTQQFASGIDLTAEALNASSIPVVSSTADITTPFTGQIVFNTTDTRLWRYTGSAWRKFSGGPVWNLRRAAAQSISSTTFTNILFDTEDPDTDGVHAAGSADVVVNQDGLYALSAKGSWATHAAPAGTRYVDITLNGTTIPGSSSRVTPLPNPDASATATPTIYQQCISGDVLRVREWHNQGSALNTATASADQPLFTGAWLRD